MYANDSRGLGSGFHPPPILAHSRQPYVFDVPDVFGWGLLVWFLGWNAVGRGEDREGATLEGDVQRLCTLSWAKRGRRNRPVFMRDCQPTKQCTQLLERF